MQKCNVLLVATIGFQMDEKQLDGMGLDRRGA